MHWYRRGALVDVVEVVGRHDLGVSIGVGEHEVVSLVVILSVLVCKHIGGCALGVVVVREGDCAVALQWVYVCML